MSNFNLYEFIKPAFENPEQYTIVRAGRRIGKTYNAFIWILLCLLANAGTKGLWVDTAQANLDKYIERYIKKILGKAIWKLCHYDKQKHILTFPNGSILDMGSAERPELLEGFSYDFCVLNEAGIILKKEGLWERTIKPMTKNATVKIIGTPKGKGSKYEELCLRAKEDKKWREFIYTVYDSPEYTESEIEELKESELPYIWEGEYMAQFTNMYENSIIKNEWINYYEVLPDIRRVFIHNDLTHTGKTTSDYFCWGMIGEGVDNNLYLIDWVLKKTDPLDQSHICINKYIQHSHYNIEKMTFDAVSNDAWGEWTKKEAKNKGISLPLQPLKIPMDKVANLKSVLPHFISGRFFINKNHEQLQLAMNQLLSFPAGKNDDMVDVVSCCLGNIETVVAIPTLQDVRSMFEKHNIK